MFTTLNREKWTSRLILILVGLGIFLRVNRYLCNFPFWGDEAWVAWDIVLRSGRDILLNIRVTDTFSVPAPGFMLVESLIVLLFGAGELVFRFFPCLCGVVSILLFKRLLKGLALNRVMPIAITFMVFSHPLIYYSTELKQYSTDIFFVLWVLIVHFRTLKDSMDNKSAVWLAISGLVGTFFSLPLILVLFGIAFAQIVICFKRRQMPAMNRYVLVLGVWLVGFGMMWRSYYHANYCPRIIEYYKQYYLSLPFMQGDWGAWFHKLFSVFQNPIDLSWPLLAGLMFLAGSYSLWRSNRGLLCSLIMPIIFTIGLSVANLYPFYGRFLIFLVPIFFIVIALGVDYVMNNFYEKRILGLIILALLLIQPVANARSYILPSSDTDIRSLMLHIRDKQRPDDRIYINNDTRWGYNYYHLVLALSNIKLMGILNEYKSSIDKPGQLFCFVSLDGRIWGNVYSWDRVVDMRGGMTRLPGGGRTWILLSQVSPEKERAFIKCFDSFGKRLDEKRSNNASLYLYDLK